ncbi:glycosyltransferase family 87 protein [Archangium lansingense]|uniref:Glycosyltransferase family 87 protein n=1 Tax=Archangium lansingense TaxID=2995310 RepID=A0ABT4A5K4_9BACT|nr:glycosyltransferase family 87 protein [Archangium lansinium]MCY1076900.1 glycosyltransferase family 87 protein [Archangium lansinium]
MATTKSPEALPEQPRAIASAPAGARPRLVAALFTPQGLFWALLLVLAVQAVILGQHPRRALDFRVYLLAAERFLAGAALYPPSDGFMPFKYAPVTAPLFLPFTLVPARVAAALWNLGSVLALGALAQLISRAASAPGERAPWHWAAPVATVALLPALHLELFYAQVDAIMLLLLVLTAVGAERGRTWGPATAFAIALLLKPPAALLGLFLLARRHWRVLTASIGVGLVLTLPSLARYGLDGLLTQGEAWLDTLARTTPPWALGHNPQGLPTLLLSLVLPVESVPSGSALAMAQGLALVLFVAVVAWSRAGPMELLAFCCLGVTLLSPLAWRANFVMAWPLLWATAARKTRGGLALVAVAGLTGVLTSDFLLGADGARHVLLWRPYALVFTALLLWLSVLARRAGRSEVPRTSLP